MTATADFQHANTAAKPDIMEPAHRARGVYMKTAYTAQHPDKARRQEPNVISHPAPISATSAALAYIPATVIIANNASRKV